MKRVLNIGVCVTVACVAIACGRERPASLERWALPLLLLEVALFAYVAARFAGVA